jgi:hypothetical protein
VTISRVVLPGAPEPALRNMIRQVECEKSLCEEFAKT